MLPYQAAETHYYCWERMNAMVRSGAAERLGVLDEAKAAMKIHAAAYQKMGGDVKLPEAEEPKKEAAKVKPGAKPTAEKV